MEKVLKIKSSGVQPLLEELDNYLIIVRWGVLAAATVIYFLSRLPRHLLVPPLLVLLVLVVFNFPITVFIWKKKPYRTRHFLWIILFDVLQSSFAVVVTGGYDSLFFVIYLLPLFEASVCFNWQMAAAWVVSIDGLQILITGFHLITTETSVVSTYAFVSRFVRLLMVGFMLIMLGEILRREDETRRNAIRSAENMEILNDAFKRLGDARFDMEKIFSIIIERVRIIEGIVYSIVLSGNSEENRWLVRATSDSSIYRVGEEINDVEGDRENTGVNVYSSYDGRINHSLFRGKTEEVIVLNLFSYSNDSGNESYKKTEDEKFLFVIGRNIHSLHADEEFFLKALALEAHTALHNAYLYKEKQEQLKRLDKFREVQSTFFSAAGHQLKTPLTILKTLFSSFELTLENPSKTQQEMLATLQTNVERLDGLISDILETAKLETVDVVIGRKRVDIVGLIERVRDSMSVIASRRRQRIIFKNLLSSRIFVLGDPKKIGEIISNIVSNALKFSHPDSEIVITLRGEEKMVIVCIHDDGIGIAEEEKENIFRKYYTATSNRALAGFGLGLYITKQLVELHGGRIWVKNERKGKSFCFTLPLYMEGNDGQKE